MQNESVSLRAHKEWKGKIEVISRVSVKSKADLSVAYTPGVAEPCLEIEKDNDLSYVYTRRHNLVAVITDGTAVLGLGDIGPLAAMPVMEGKCALFKEFADIDAFPICINSKDPDVIVETIRLISGSFGGINLEDISAPRCFDIEKRLRECCDIPVFHDDQHGTAVVVLAALLNSLKLVKKDIASVSIVINGAGAAGSSICKMLLLAGAHDIVMCDVQGILYKGQDGLDPYKQQLTLVTNEKCKKGRLSDAIKAADVFIGVSKANLLHAEDIKNMASRPIVFPMANPVPEIDPAIAKEAGAYIVGTGRSDIPNQINNVMAFPGIFRGALDIRAKDISEEMQIAAAHAIASLVSDEELTVQYILPLPFDKRLVPAVSKAVMEAGIKNGLSKITY
jgi:malate dehydrogenase (oxaloacetate-decarboxylating)